MPIYVVQELEFVCANCTASKSKRLKRRLGDIEKPPRDSEIPEGFNVIVEQKHFPTYSVLCDGCYDAWANLIYEDPTRF